MFFEPQKDDIEKLREELIALIKKTDESLAQFTPSINRISLLGSKTVEEKANYSGIGKKSVGTELELQEIKDELADVEVRPGL